MIDDELRGGSGDTVFMVSGAGGAAEELAGLAAALDGDPRVIALVPLAAPDDGEVATTVETMATAAVALIRSHQPSGPYRLLGYSLGGVVALETAQLLRDEGEVVGFLGLVDALFDRRHWPTALFIRARARRLVVHGRTLLGMPTPRAFRAVYERIRRRAGQDAGAAETVQDRNLAILASWRPRVFEGPIVFFAAEETDFGCDLADLWRPWLPGMQVRRVPGNHIELVQDPDGIDRLAHAVNAALDASASPRLDTLVATTFRWTGAARLAVDLNASGCIVRAVAPRGSALHKIVAVEQSHALGLMNPVGSLRRAIESSPADLIIPFDDRTRRALHRIHADADPATEGGSRLRGRLERSLGPPELYPDIYSRVGIMEIAGECGVLCPPTAAVRSAAEIEQWLTRHPGRAVVKTDGSWGGRETRVIDTAADVRKAWRQLSRPPNLARCVKRLLVERDPWPLGARLTGYRPRLSIQSFVEGTPGNAAVACLDGELLGAVQAEVVRAQGPTGPSTVLRVTEHPEMLATASAMVARLRMSGLAGFDFILERDTGRAHLIEVNPRATPTSHLITAEGIDLLTSLRSVLGYPGPPPRTAAYPDGLVALFPQELGRDPAGAIVEHAHHDIPWHAPDLVAYALAELRSPGAREQRDPLAGLETTAGLRAGWSPDPPPEDHASRPGPHGLDGHRFRSAA